MKTNKIETSLKCDEKLSIQQHIETYEHATHMTRRINGPYKTNKSDALTRAKAMSPKLVVLFRWRYKNKSIIILFVKKDHTLS